MGPCSYAPTIKVKLADGVRDLRTRSSNAGVFRWSVQRESTQSHNVAYQADLESECLTIIKVFSLW
jgi:hypothetical protein